MRNDFCVFILTHGRPDRIFTLKALESHGYTGKVFLVVDDEDKTRDDYIRRYGDRVLTFSKKEEAAATDDGDNFPGMRGVIYARNASFDLARKVGCRYFVQLDDDYSGFYYRFDGSGFYGNWKLEPLDWLFSAFVNYLAATPFASIALSQGGDHIGGGESKRVNGTKRKAMNSFFCDVDRPFKFLGRINEDTTTYVCEQRRGLLFLTVMAAQLNQKATQTNTSGMTDLYLDYGTYVKSFYSVMYAPSAVKITAMGDNRIEGRGHKRLHHLVDYNAAAPCIIRERHRKASLDGKTRP